MSPEGLASCGADGPVDRPGHLSGHDLEPVANGRPEPTWVGPPVAIFWDQSLVWGLLCWDTLRHLRVPLRLLSAVDIHQGVLQRYGILLVPGGWASHKVQALGEAGAARIREFVTSGGSYVGFCGGAGLALSSGPAIGLAPLGRQPLSARLPNASGEIWIGGDLDHPAWKDLPVRIPVSIWWPSQFRWEQRPDCRCLATYEAAGDDFWVADLRVADLRNQGGSWPAREAIYGINLDPARLLGQPAIAEVALGAGQLLLSYPHLETPGDFWGNRLLLNLLRYAASQVPGNSCKQPAPSPVPLSRDCAPGPESIAILAEAAERASALIDCGEQHLLWRWHRPWLLRWQRGMRGLEYGTLAASTRFLAALAQQLSDGNPSAHDPWLARARSLGETVEVFCRAAHRLVLEEMLAQQSGSIAKLNAVNATVDRLRTELFGGRMNHDGQSRKLFSRIDTLLHDLVKLAETMEEAGCIRIRPLNHYLRTPPR